MVHWLEKLDRAYEIMMDVEVRHLPVVDNDLAVIGIISDRDFYRAMKEDREEFDPEARVREYMSWPVASIKEEASIAEAARIMVDKKISSLLVIREGRISGIVTTEDLLRALLESSEGKLHDLKIGLQAAIYRSPIGQIAHALANAGI